MSTVTPPKPASAGKPAAGARVPFKVRAFDLAAAGKREEAETLVALGRKEIELAEDEMPGLMILRQRQCEDTAAQRCQDHGFVAHDCANGCIDRDTG